MEKKHRDRGENWTSEEREIFIDLMKFSARIIECKNNDTDTNRRKQTEWYKVQKKFQELTGKLRGVPQLKGFWRRTRMLAKKKVFQHRRALYATGGRMKLPSPSQEIQKIVEMCPTDFIKKEKDSDVHFYNNEIIHNDEQKDRMVDDLACASVPSQHEDTKRTLAHTFNIEMVPNNRPCLPPMLEREMMYEVELENMSTPRQPQNTTDRTRNRSQIEKSPKSTVESNIDIKEQTFRLLEEEYALKLRYQRQELRHQEQRHKLEIDILLIEKEKKECELKLLQK